TTNASGEEDTHILFGDKITFTKPDNDGSEQISRVEITGFGSTDVRNAATPTGPLTAVGTAVITFTGGTVTITGSEADIRATLDTLTVRQVTNSDADINLTINARTKDGVAVASADGTNTQVIVVDAQADAPVPTIAAVAGNEDTMFVVGDKISFGRQDNDGTEWVSSITIAALPAGWTAQYTANAAVTVTGTATTGYTISVANKADAALLRALVDTFAVQAPTNSDVDATLSVTVTTTDADNSTATSAIVSTPIVVNAIADMPSATASNATGNEDVFITLTLASGISGDTDGSETRTVSITGVPAGSAFSAGTLTGSVWTGTAAQLATLEYKAPTQFSGPINMVLVTRSTETNGGDFAEASAPFTVTIVPILDGVGLSNSSQTINEDTTIPVGAQFNIGLIDLDGSQNLSYTVSGIPAGYTVSSTVSGTASMSALSGGSVTFSGSNANDVINAIRSMNLLVTGGGAAANKDTNFQLSISASTSENAGGGSSTGTATHDVKVAARADQPTVGSTAVLAHNEDPASPIAFPITAVLTDLDGSETLSRVDVTIANFATAINSINYNTGLAGTVTVLATGLRFEGTTAQIQALLASITITPKTHSDVDFTVRVDATSTESNPTEVGAGEVSLLTATRTTNYNVVMTAVADQPNVSAPAITSPFLTEEDTPIAITGLTGSLVDADGSETLTFQIRDVPTGASFSSGTNSGGGVWTFTAAQLAANPTFTPPAGASGTYDLTLRAIATETTGGFTASNDTVFRIVVDPEADVPNLTATATINEDTATTIGSGIVYSTNDPDTSEYINQITIAAFPANWSASFGTTHPNVTIAGDALTGFTLSISNAADAANLRSVLNSLSVTAPPQSDVDIAINVTARSIDLDGSQRTQTTSLPITVRAIADAPGATGNDVSGTEDTTVALSLSASMGVDSDGSETLSARITGVPTGGVLAANLAGGGTLVDSGGGIWSITAPDTAALNAILASMTFTPPPHLHGTVNMQLEVTSTEAANGGQVVTKTAVTTDSFTVTLEAVADVPNLQIIDSTGGAAGYEDTPIPLIINGTTPDTDGSEILSYKISNVPTGATFLNGSGTPVGTLVSPGVYSFTAAEIIGLRIKPPLNSNDDFTLQVTMRTTETVPGFPGNGDFEEVTAPLQVAVIGVADMPNLTVPPISSAEDQPIPLGATIVGSLVDNVDGSETLFYVISGLPAGVVPSVGTYIGGQWQVAAADIASLTIPAPVNFSGNYTATYAPNLKVRAVAQENDGNQIFVEAPLNVTITPVMDAFPGWSPGITVTEDNNISLASAAFNALPDNDGSEKIEWYEFNLNGVVTSDNVTSTQSLIDTFINGTFTDQGGGIIRVQAADLAGVSLMATAFKDSNIDFTIPVKAHVTESGGLTQDVNGTYSVNLVGDADTPTTYAQNVTGISGQPIRLNPNATTGFNFGGDITDTDVGQGRTNSERIYYIVSGVDTPGGIKVAFVNSAGAIAGFNNNDGTWLLTRADLQDLHIISRFGDVGTTTLQLTSVTVENDGDLAQSASPVNFQATFSAATGSGGTVIPQTPTIAITPMTTNEDGNVIFTVNVSPGPGEPPLVTPSVVLMISDLPPGATITGATFNPSTGRYIATATDLQNGNVVITPPPNFSGTMNVTVEAVATNAQLNATSTGPQIIDVTVTPVADGPSIAATPAAGAEDTATALNISVGLTDTDAASPEQLISPIRVIVSNGATLSAGTAIGGGVYELTPAQLAGLTITPPANWHGAITVTVQASSFETANNDTRQTTSTFTVNVAPVADAPVANASNVSGTEDSVIALTGLSASLVDTDGSEKLSVKIFGIPDESILSAGGNNGDGSWTIPVADLATLTIKPPRDYSGTMSLSLEAYALDANGSVATTTVPFTVTVTPLGDAITLNAQEVTGTEDQPIALNLGLAAQDTNGTNPGENAAEIVELTFTDLRSGSDILATAGGTLTRISATSVQFTGTVAQANALAYQSALHDSINDTVNVSAVAIDGTSRGPATAGSFLVRVIADADVPTLSSFTAGAPTSTQVPLSLSATFPDMDGSETQTIRISGVPAGASLSVGTDLTGGVWELTAAQLVGLNYNPGTAAGSVTLTAQAKAVETINADQALSGTQTVTFFTGTSAANTMAGTGADDLISGFAGNDTIAGNAGADTIYGGTGNDSLTGGGGADSLLGGDGTDNLNGGTEADFLSGESANDTLAGGDGNDTLNGGLNDDSMAGDNGADSLLGGDGNDSMTGGLDADFLSGEIGLDTLRGGDGNDTLNGGTGNDSLFGDNNDDSLLGEAGNDSLQGGDGNDTLDGGIDADSLTGGNGNDSLVGGDGNDTLTGGVGADILSGGLGVDTLVWATADLATGPDTVTDYAAGAGGDRLNLSALLTGFSAGVTPVTGFVQFVESGGNTTVNIDANGGGDNFSTSVAILQGVTGLNAETMRLNGTLIV
ncbi:MAG: beta strand repeat-containing protein, partial [Beijerinckiaceae bacterium]